MASSSSSNSAGGAHPLRPYYQPPAEFGGSAPRFSTTASTQNVSSAVGAGNSSASVKTATNRYTSGNNGASYVATSPSGTVNGENLTGKDFLRFTATFAARCFVAECFSMPLEVGKLLLQVQWLPRDEVWLQVTQQAALNASREQQKQRSTTNEANSPELGGETQDTGISSWVDGDAELEASFEADDLSDNDDVDAYFRDPSSRPEGSRSTSSGGTRKRRHVDKSGYVMRSSVHDSDGRPDFVMPVVVRGGIWDMIKAVARGKEGWYGLFKGTFTSSLLENVTVCVNAIVQPVIALAASSALIEVPLPIHPQPLKALGILMSVEMLTAFIVSPLDLVRTRLIVQSTLPNHRKYSGPYDALKKVSREEGGWRSVYLHPNVLIPTLLSSGLRNFFGLGGTLFLERGLRLERTTQPVSYAIAKLVLELASLGITYPIDTVRRRLQVQSRATSSGNGQLSATAQITSASLKSSASAKPDGVGLSAGTAGVGIKALRTCVETRPVAYVGVVEAMYRIVTEESTVVPPQSPKQSSSSGDESPDAMARSSVLARARHSSLGGVRSLYRGLGLEVGAAVMVFLLTLVSGESLTETGWAEI